MASKKDDRLKAARKAAKDKRRKMAKKKTARELFGERMSDSSGMTVRDSKGKIVLKT